MNEENSRYSQFLLFGTMSSGKSTVINSILGKKLLAMSNFSCTAKETRIMINAGAEGNNVFIEKKNGEKTLLRNQKDEDIYKCRYNEEEITRVTIETNSRNVFDTSKKILLIDTPGGNCIEDKSHQEEAERVLSSAENEIIFYVLNTTQIGTEDDAKLLADVKRILVDKRAEIVFVLNKTDNLEDRNKNLEDFIQHTVKRYIESTGIKNHIIFPYSAEAALLFQCAIREDRLSETECDKLYKYYKFYNRGIMDAENKKGGAEKEEQTVTYDGENYSINRLRMALDHTGINEILNFISQMSV